MSIPNKSTACKKPGPKGPSRELIRLIIDIKRNNPTYGCPRIADIVNNSFGIDIEKDIVRRVLINYYRPDRGSIIPSWQAFIGHTKDSLWAMDLFCCESITLRTHWVLVVMDIYSRKIVGFAVNVGPVNGECLRRMFASIGAGKDRPRHIVHDHDPIFKSWWWVTYLACWTMTSAIGEIWSVPSTPVSNPYVERLVGTVRREYLDHVLFWNCHDLEMKLKEFQTFYNDSRVHRSLCGQLPSQWAKEQVVAIADINHYKWKSHCHGFYRSPQVA